MTVEYREGNRGREKRRRRGGTRDLQVNIEWEMDKFMSEERNVFFLKEQRNIF